MSNTPSFRTQTKWPCGIIDFGELANNRSRYFNPTIVTRRDGDWLIARHAVPGPPNSPLARLGMNDLEAFRISEDYRVANRFKVQFPKMYRDEHFEDPRASVIGGRVAISCTNFQLIRGLPWYGSHQVFAIVDEGWKVVSRADPIYGLNGATPYVQRGSEKSWLWFEHNRRAHMVYTAVPHQVAVFESGQSAARTYATTAKVAWKHGVIRGGTPPVRVGDEYWTFFHSSLPWKNKKRQYHMGAYAFAAEPPFPITQITPMPLLSGSQHDPWSPNLPLVIFPGGAIYRDGKWRVVFGVNDCRCGWITIPHGSLVPLMKPVKSKEIAEFADVAGNQMTGTGREIDESKVTLVAV